MRILAKKTIYPLMKKTTFLVAFCCLAFLSNAQNNETSIAPAVEITTSEEVSPKPVASSNGIDVYYFSTSDQSGNTLLDIHFENTNEEAMTFTWEIAKEGQIFKSQKSISIKPGKSFDQNGVLEVKGTTDLSDYSITLTIK